MKYLTLTKVTVTLVVCIFVASDAQAQVRYRLPLSSLPSISAWFDHNPYNGFKKYTCSTSGAYNGHEGTDFPTYSGRTIYSGAAGELYYRQNGCADTPDGDCGGGFGNHVRIKHKDSKVSIYAHMKKGTPVFTQSLLCSAKIGGVGNSGDSKGEHLHFEIWSSTSGSTSVDPFAGSCSQTTNYWANVNSSGMPTTACQPTIYPLP